MKTDREEPIVDVIAVYKRIHKAVKRRTGTRLTYMEAAAIWHDGAVQQAVETAEYEAEEPVATRIRKEGNQ